jgi:hypothetical protein
MAPGGSGVVGGALEALVSGQAEELGLGLGPRERRRARAALEPAVRRAAALAVQGCVASMSRNLAASRGRALRALTPDTLYLQVFRFVSACALEAGEVPARVSMSALRRHLEAVFGAAALDALEYGRVVREFLAVARDQCVLMGAQTWRRALATQRPPLGDPTSVRFGPAPERPMTGAGARRVRERTSSRRGR